MLSNIVKKANRYAKKTIEKNLGLEIKRASKKTIPSHKKKVQAQDFYSRLKHMKSLGFSPKWIVDGGALTGKWAKKVHNIYPDSNFIVVEPNPLVQDSIKETLKDVPKEKYHLVEAALADSESTMNLNVWADPRHSKPLTQFAASSLKSHVQGEPNKSFSVKVTKLDTVVDTNQFGCDLIKLDLQGAEKEALLGAKECLKKAEVVVCEFGLLDAYVERTTPNDLIQMLAEYNFCLYDIVDLRYRPYDNAMAGGDFIFVKNDSKLKKYKDYN